MGPHSWQHEWARKIEFSHSSIPFPSYHTYLFSYGDYQLFTIYRLVLFKSSYICDFLREYRCHVLSKTHAKSFDTRATQEVRKTLYTWPYLKMTWKPFTKGSREEHQNVDQESRRNALPNYQAELIKLNMHAKSDMSVADAKKIRPAMTPAL